MSTEPLAIGVAEVGMALDLQVEAFPLAVVAVLGIGGLPWVALLVGGLTNTGLVTLGDASTVNRGCVLQTHLFHDRVMSMDAVVLGQGASLGPHGVVLPAASLADGASVGPASLVLRGDAIPAGSRWTGNPVAPVQL